MHRCLAIWMKNWWWAIMSQTNVIGSDWILRVGTHRWMVACQSYVSYVVHFWLKALFVNIGFICFIFLFLCSRVVWRTNNQSAFFSGNFDQPPRAGIFTCIYIYIYVFNLDHVYTHPYLYEMWFIYIYIYYSNISQS